MQTFRVSPYVFIGQFDDNCYALWNYYSPSVLKLNRKAALYLESIKHFTVGTSTPNTPSLELLKKYKILHSEENDSSRQVFIDSVHGYLATIKRMGESFLRDEKDYETLMIVNDRCNLACAYCVNMYKYSKPRMSIPDKDKKQIVFSCIDQFFQRKNKNGKKVAKILFNGGEILLEWSLIKEIIDYIETSYSTIEVEYSMNSNFTLMTSEIARFFADKKVSMFVSIDGYKEIHDKSRIYGDKSGSFERVIQGVKTFRRYNPNSPITGFQGTIDFVDEFRPERVYDMKKYGFSSARLSPNLLNTNIEDAKKKARLMGEFLELNERMNFQVTETYFDNMKKLINLDDYYFFFNCKGLSCYPSIGISVNIDTFSLSNVCSFVQKGFVPFEKLDFNIYHPDLWEVSWKYIRERMVTLLETCIDCELVAICRGGCIYTGLDKNNELNETACAYNRELWKVYLSRLLRTV